MPTPNNPTPNLQLDRRVSNGNPFPAELYDDNMSKIDTHAAAVLAALAQKVGKSGDSLSGLLDFVFNGIFMAFGTNDKFCLSRFANEYHLTYNAFHNGTAWTAYDISLPSFRMTFTQQGKLEFYTAPPAPAITWTKRLELSASQVLATAPFAAQSTSTFGGKATFNSEIEANQPATFNALVTLAGGFNLGNALTENFEGLWQVLGSNADKFTVQRVESSVYFTYNMFHNGSAWTNRDATKPSLAIQYTQTGELRVRFAPAGSIVWQTITTVNSTDLVCNKRLSATGDNYAAIFGTSTDKLVIIRDPDTGEYSIAYNVNDADANTKQDVAKASTRVTFTTAGLIQMWHAPAGASNTWTKIFEMSSSAITLAKAVTMAQVLTSQVTTGTAPFVVASTTKVDNLNADMVDGIHATTIPHTTNRDALYDYTSGWVSVSTGANTYTFTHNLGVVPRFVMVQFRPGTSGNATQNFVPGPHNGVDNEFPYSYHSDVNTLKIVTGNAVAGSFVGVDSAGSVQTSGQYRVLLIK